jgi:formylmethanofuran--tetrahydromethanopterin N-formyltransferase
MKVRGVEVEETFAEAFPMYISRILITAQNDKWALASAQETKGLGTTAVFCPTEAGIENNVSSSETPDGRPGVIVQIGHQKKKKVEKWMPIRIRHCILSTPTAAAFDAMPKDIAEYYLEMKGTPVHLFADGYEEEDEMYGESVYKIPLMGGWFNISKRFGVAKGVAGGNLLFMGESISAALSAAEAAVEAIRKVKYVFTPAVGGTFASGSKPKKTYPWATTNHYYCACIAEKVKDTKIPLGVEAVFEVVINGLNMNNVKGAMREAIQTALQIKGLRKITAANYGGNLGPYKIYLADLL